eukprot:m.876866 g.876866  ORF g.876866 m.876866 type:complete len:101 (+) comp23580_c0_seq23:4077-4379(+)
MKCEEAFVYLRADAEARAVDVLRLHVRDASNKKRIDIDIDLIDRIGANYMHACMRMRMQLLNAFASAPAPAMQVFCRVSGSFQISGPSSSDEISSMIMIM